MTLTELHLGHSLGDVQDLNADVLRQSKRAPAAVLEFLSPSSTRDFQSGGRREAYLDGGREIDRDVDERPEQSSRNGASQGCGFDVLEGIYVTEVFLERGRIHGGEEGKEIERGCRRDGWRAAAIDPSTAPPKASRPRGTSSSLATGPGLR